MDFLMSKVRVAFVLPSLVVGGMQRHVCRLAEYIDREKFLPYIVSLSGATQVRAWVHDSSVRLVEMSKRPGNDLLTVLRLARWLKEEKIDIIHSHNWGTLVECTLARWLAGTPVHIHSERGTVLGSLDHRSLRTRVRAIAARCCLRFTNVLVTNAHSIAKTVSHLCGVKPHRIAVIPNGVPTLLVDRVRVAAIRSNLALSQGRAIIGSVGRLDWVKSFDTAVRALACLVNRGMNVVMVIVGDGPCRNYLLSLAKEMNVRDNLILPGYQQDVANWISAMDIYFNSSISEGLSQSVVEAMSLARPLVLTSVGDHITFGTTNRPCALVVPPGSPEQLSTAFVTLIGNRKLRTRLAENAVFHVRETHSLTSMISRYECLYMAQLHSKR